MSKLDDLTGYILEQLVKTGLDKCVNVILLSDHGVNSFISPNIIDLRSFVANGACEMFGTSPVIQIVPAKGECEVRYGTFQLVLQIILLKFRQRERSVH